MPLVKGAVSLAAAATSDAILTGTTYEYIPQNSSLRVAAATDQAAAADGSSVVMNFTMNNTELTKNGAVSQKVDGEPFGANGNYTLNDTTTPPDSVRNRTIITFTNKKGENVKYNHVMKRIKSEVDLQQSGSTHDKIKKAYICYYSVNCREKFCSLFCLINLLSKLIRLVYLSSK